MATLSRIPLDPPLDPGQAAAQPQLTPGPLMAPLTPNPADVAPLAPAGMPRIGDDTPMGRFALPVIPPPADPGVMRIPTPVEQQRDAAQRRLDSEEHAVDNPLGSANNHPGFWGKTAHVLGRIGNIAGDVLAPNAMSLIPGTDLNRGLRERQDLNDVRTLSDEASQEDQRESQKALEAAETTGKQLENADEPQKAADASAQSGAETKHLGAETNALENPAPEYQSVDTIDGPMILNKKTGTAQRMTADGLPIGPKVQTKVVQIEVGGKPHQFLVNNTTGDFIRDMGESGEKPPTVNVNAGEASLDREAKMFGTPHQTALTQGQGQIEKINNALVDVNGNAAGQGLAAAKVLTALVSGQGTGVRITNAELQSFMHARGIAGDAEGFINRLSGDGQFAKSQQKQVSAILNDAKARLAEKIAIHNAALDAINSGADRKTIVDADSKARKQINDLEIKGHYEGQTKVYQGHTYSMGGDDKWHLQ